LQGIDPAGVTAYREGIVAKKYKGLEGLLKARGIRSSPDRVV
jgi:dihydrolipoamide dehydrogenase